MKKNLLFSLLLLLFTAQINFPQSFTNVASQIGINSINRDYYYIPGTGVGFADYDNDGDPDMIMGNMTNFRVYRNDNGFYTNVTTQSGLDFTGDCLKSVVWGDYNNDGWRDVYLTSWYSGNRLYKNNGNGTFKMSHQQQVLVWL
jgi:hypothetical protein